LDRVPTRIPAGLRYMAYGAFWFSIMSLFVKLAGQRIPSMQIVFVRAVITLALSWALVRRARLPLWGNRRGMLLLRGLLGFGALSCFYFSIVHLPLAEATVIQYLNPVFAAIIAAIVIGERLGPREITGVLVSMAGVLLIARPSFVFGGATTVSLAYVAIAVAGAMFSAIAYVAVRMLRGVDHHLVVVFYFPLVTVPLSLPFAVAMWVPPTTVDWLLLLGVAIATQFAQVHMTHGLQLEPTGRATAIGYIQIVFAALWGIVLLGEHPDWWTALGAAVIIGGTLLVGWRRAAPGSSPMAITAETPIEPESSRG
jgi:drug/metabolite transporter (DMT)-like permease